MKVDGASGKKRRKKLLLRSLPASTSTTPPKRTVSPSSCSLRTATTASARTV